MKLFQTYNADNNTFPIVVSIPHSGRYIPTYIRERFNHGIILPNMDWYLDILYSFLEAMGVTVIVANYSRYVIDLNRGLHLKNETGDYRGTLVYDKSTFGKSIYTAPLSDTDINDRVVKYYLPYYAQLEKLIDIKLQYFEKGYLLDLHSFYQQTDKDICLGTAEGMTASSNTLSCMTNHLMNEGFSVDENTVFRGGHCIRHFREKFDTSLESVAFEIRYTTYLEKRYFGEEEVTTWDNELFLLSQTKLERAFNGIFEEWG